MTISRFRLPRVSARIGTIWPSAASWTASRTASSIWPENSPLRTLTSASKIPRGSRNPLTEKSELPISTVKPSETTSSRAPSSTGTKAMVPMMSISLPVQIASHSSVPRKPKSLSPSPKKRSLSSRTRSPSRPPARSEGNRSKSIGPLISTRSPSTSTGTPRILPSNNRTPRTDSFNNSGSPSRKGSTITSSSSYPLSPEMSMVSASVAPPRARTGLKPRASSPNAVLPASSTSSMRTSCGPGSPLLIFTRSVAGRLSGDGKMTSSPSTSTRLTPVSSSTRRRRLKLRPEMMLPCGGASMARVGGAFPATPATSQPASATTAPPSIATIRYS